MNKTSILQSYLHLNTSFSNDIGLLNGKSCSVLFFSCLKDQYYRKEISFSFLQEIFSQVDVNTPLTFGNGIAGLGTLLEYLVNEEILEQDTNELLEEFELHIVELISSQKCYDISISNGISGLGIYLLARYQSIFSSSQSRKVLFKNCIISAVNQIKQYLDSADQGVANTTSILGGLSGVYIFLNNVRALGWNERVTAKAQSKIEALLFHRLQSAPQNQSHVETWFVLLHFNNASVFNTFDQVFDFYLKWYVECIGNFDLYNLAFHALLFHLMARQIDHPLLPHLCDLLVMRVKETIEETGLSIVFPFDKTMSCVPLGFQKGVCGTALPLLTIENNNYSWLKMLGIDIK